MKNIIKVTALTVLLSVSTFSHTAGAGFSPSSSMSETPWTFDGVPLGKGYLEGFGELPQYGFPCDIDPINDGARSVIFYTAKVCNQKSFPENTTLVLFTHPVMNNENLNPPVTTIAWMGGTYMNSRSTFPAKIGMNDAEVKATLGEVSETGRMERNGKSLIVRKHESLDGMITYSMSVGGKSVGFIAGEMPAIDFESEDHEEWNAVAAGFFRFTPELPATPTPTPQPSPEPGQPPVNTDPFAIEVLNQFFGGLLITDNESQRFAALKPTLHRSLLRRDGTDFAPGIREYAYRRACREVSYFEFPVTIERVARGNPTAIIVGNEKDLGRIDKYFVMPKPEYQSTISPAPIHIFFPENGGEPRISNFGSL